MAKRERNPRSGRDGEDIWADDSPGAIVSNIVFLKAEALRRNDLTKIEYEVELTTKDGMTIKDSGTLRRDPPLEEIRDFPGSGFGSLFGRGKEGRNP